MGLTVGREAFGFVERGGAWCSHLRTETGADELQGRTDNEVLTHGLSDCRSDLIQDQGSKTDTRHSLILSDAGVRVCRGFWPYFAEP